MSIFNLFLSKNHTKQLIMTFKKILLTLSFLLTNLVLFSQQIGSGFAPAAINDFNKELPSGFYEGLYAAGEVDGSGYNHLLNLRHSNPANNHQLQIASSYFENDKLFFRKFARGLGSNNPVWYEIATRGGNTFNGNQTIIGNQTLTGNLTIGQDNQISTISGPGFSGVIQIKSNYAQGGSINRYLRLGFKDNNALFYPALSINDDLNVGIGTQTPSAKLDVVGDIYIDNVDWSTDNALRIREGGSNSYGAFFKYGLNDLLTIGTRNADSDHIAFQIPRGSLNVTFNGNVGIGTTTPDQKLTVNGTIHSKEIIVDTNITPDYVFQKYYTGKSELKEDYIIPTLAEIESFTKKNNHLPGVPSAKEMQEKGISLGEMSNILLQKIEELTLYTIEQKKELECLRAENENYKSLAERLSAIENELKK